MQPEDTALPILWGRWCRGCGTACPCCPRTGRARARRADCRGRHRDGPAARAGAPAFPAAASNPASTPCGRSRRCLSRKSPAGRRRCDIRSPVRRQRQEKLSRPRVDGERSRLLPGRIGDGPARRQRHVDVAVEVARGGIIGVGVRRQAGLTRRRRPPDRTARLSPRPPRRARWRAGRALRPTAFRENEKRMRHRRLGSGSRGRVLKAPGRKCRRRQGGEALRCRPRENGGPGGRRAVTFKSQLVPRASWSTLGPRGRATTSRTL